MCRVSTGHHPRFLKRKEKSEHGLKEKDNRTQVITGTIHLGPHNFLSIVKYKYKTNCYTTMWNRQIVLPFRQTYYLVYYTTQQLN